MVVEGHCSTMPTEHGKRTGCKPPQLQQRGGSLLWSVTQKANAKNLPLSEVISLSHTHTHTGNDVQNQGDTTKERETDLTCQPVQTDRHSLNTLYGTTRKS